MLLVAAALGSIAMLVRCGNSDNTFPLEGPDASGDEGINQDDVFFPKTDSPGGNCGGKPPVCSADGHSVVDCNNAVVQACTDAQGCSAGTCIPACDAAIANKSSVGCEYYAHNPNMALGKGCFALYVANTWTSPVTVTGDIGGTKLDLTKYTYLPAGSGQNLKMNPIGQGGTIPVGKVGIVFLRDNGFQMAACGYGVNVAEKDPAAASWQDPASGTSNAATALRVVASAPVVVYDILPFGGGRSAVTDATLLLPTSTWDTNYIVITPRPLGNNTNNPGLAIVAAADGTNVTIKPTADITAGTGVAGTTKGTPITYPLKKGQVLRIEQAADLLGSIVSSNNPVGVWAEQNCINIDACCCDGAHEQLPPIRAFGSEYVYARYRNRVDGQDETPPTRITGAVDGTTLTFDPKPMGAQTTVNKGESFEVRSSAPFVVKSQDDKHPFYVGTYMTGGGNFAGAGDPEFVNVVPTGQYLSKYVFFTDPTYPETDLVMVRKKGADNAFHDVALDCGGNVTGWKPVGSGGAYEWALRDLVRHNFAPQNGCDNGAHEAHSDGPFTMTVWGWGTTETDPNFQSTYVSYAYPAGASVQSINSVIVPPN